MKKPKVLVTSVLPGNTQNLLEENFDLTVFSNPNFTRQELLAEAKDKDAIVSTLVARIDEEFMAACPQIKIAANVAVGYDNIDVAAASQRGILVCNTPGVLTDTTADLAFGLLLATARRIPESEQYLRDGKWQSFSMELLLGVDVHHKTIGIIGMGRIGQAVAARARGFSMKVIYSQRNRVEESLEKSLDATLVSMDELLQSSDFISIHCPSTAETKHLIDKAKLEKMKASAILINTARGAIVNETDLLEALQNGTIAAAGLDVFENEPHFNEKLKSLKNVVLLPHIGSASIETRTAMGRLAVEAVISAFNGTLPHNTVNKDTWPQFQSRLL